MFLIFKGNYNKDSAFNDFSLLLIHKMIFPQPDNLSFIIQTENVSFYAKPAHDFHDPILTNKGEAGKNNNIIAI